MDQSKRPTLGSLFDGSGGFPLAGTLNGITPLWASEIEPYPMRVTALRFPEMKQLGDVTKINGAEADPVDIITFGSPCQDLSVAGAQKGIHEGQRSSLFFEAIRIIKEMRNATANQFPRFGVWENVPGAFSSNVGEDFRSVIQAFADIREPGVSIPRPKKWGHAGCVVGDGWSIAWRLYDAQYWGVPQRRKRIYLIADFASERAGEILFECDGLRGDPAESGEERQATASDAEGGAGGSGGVKCLNPWDLESYRLYDAGGAYATLPARENSGLNHQGICAPADSSDLCAGGFVGGQGAKSGSVGYEAGVAPTLRSGITSDVCYCLQGNGIDRADTAGCNGCGWRTGQSYTLNTIDRPAIAATVGSFMSANEGGR